MKIDERLNLIVPLYEDEHVVGYVHSIPLLRAVFEAHWRLLSMTFSGIFSSGLGELAGPRVAALLLRDIAAKWELDAETLIQEIYRLSCLIRPGAQGWEQVPLHDAIRAKLISEEDHAEVLNALVFFTAVSAMWPRRKTLDLLPGVAKLWGAETSFSPPTAWIASLPTLNVTAPSGETEPSTFPGFSMVTHPMAAATVTHAVAPHARNIQIHTSSARS